jgi:hypothetical protein
LNFLICAAISTDSAAVFTSPWVQTEIPFWEVSPVSFPDDGSRHDSDVVGEKT